MVSEASVRASRPFHAGPFCVREVEYRPGMRQATHAHPYMGVSLVLAGGFRERVARAEEIGSALSVVVKPVGVEHADEVSAHGARTLQITFDPAAIPDAQAVPVLQTWRWLHGGAMGAEMLKVLRDARAGKSASHVECSIIDALSAAALDEPARGTPPLWLRRVRERLEDDPSAAVAQLAGEAGVHAVSLSRAFRRHYGVSVSDLRRRVRLRRAAAQLAGDAERLSRVAHAAGYADHAHLCRDFRRLAGMAPSQFRELALTPLESVISVQARETRAP